MAFTSSKRRSSHYSTFSVILLVMFFAAPAHGFTLNGTASRPLVPALIAFGDSIIDPGNNNLLLTSIRFSNGLIPSNMLASALGIKQLLPPYLGVDLRPEDILTGVSFASAGTGYDPLTTKFWNAEELKMFQEYKERLTAIAGEEKSEEIISQALFKVCAGTNDLTFNYLGTPFRRLQYDIPAYLDLLVSYASKSLKQLCDLGARKIGYIGMPPVGCVPSRRTLAGGLLRNCDEATNRAAQTFNQKNPIMYNILLDVIQRSKY